MDGTYHNIDEQVNNDEQASKQDYSFITFGGPSDSSTLASKKTVRAEAAKRSAGQRRATIAQRHQPLRWADQPESPGEDKAAKKQKGKPQPHVSTIRPVEPPAAAGRVVGKVTNEDSPTPALRYEPSGANLLHHQQAIKQSSDWRPNLVAMINKCKSFHPASWR